MNASRTNAAPHARSKPAGSAASESVKICTGMFGSAWPKTSSDGAAGEDRGRSAAAAPSRPAARATASTVPVTMPPSAAGRTTVSTVRQRATPSASAASRSWRGTSSSISWLARAISGIMIDRQRDRAREARLAMAGDQQAEDEQADDDRRQAVEDVEREPDRPAPAAGRRTPSGRSRSARRAASRSASPSATITAVPTIAGAMPPLAPPNCGGSRSEEVEAERAAAALDDGQDDDRRGPRRRAARPRSPCPRRARLTSRRRRRLPARRRAAPSGRARRRLMRGDRVLSDVEAAPDPLREQVAGDADHEQDQRRGRTAMPCAGPSSHPGTAAAMRLASVSAGRETARRAIDEPAPITCVTAIASPSARPRPRKTAAATPGRRRRQHDAADDLPARGAERGRAVLQLLRDRQEQVAAQRRDDRHDHDRQDQPGGEHAAARRLRRAEDRQEAEPVVQRTARGGRARTGSARGSPRTRGSRSGSRRAARRAGRPFRAPRAARAARRTAR